MTQRVSPAVPAEAVFDACRSRAPRPALGRRGAARGEAWAGGVLFAACEGRRLARMKQGARGNPHGDCDHWDLSRPWALDRFGGPMFQ